MNDLLQKYNVASPRYTSYPTVPYWENTEHSLENWQNSLKNAFWTSGREVSIYVHLPYCESLCTYCGCTTRITTNHNVEEPYIELIEREWNLYIKTLPQKPILREVHLGGGTPTFFSPKNLTRLITIFKSSCDVPVDTEWGFEGHPNNTTREHLQTLKELGFNRVSFGIQDFDENVQKIINRIQPYQKVVECVKNARELGFESINFDLVYGLPLQNIETIQNTLQKTLELRPSRLAFYGYAHIPWLKPSQKKLESFLPAADEKANLYAIGKKILTEQGYVDIGMDHFALPTDSLLKASKNGTLHRNFMGYTTQSTSLSIGLGVSAISDTWTAFNQNEKNLKVYREKVENNEFPFLRGHYLTKEDLVIRQHILDLMCRYETSWNEEEFYGFGLGINFDLLESLKQDSLVEWKGNHLRITEKGKPFVRNVCMAFDVRLWNSKLNKENAENKPMFSKNA
ncbi:oxygen-independent coproporphyrinogen III oxidase [Bernardetia sp. ABR2-2B]|uniref:oxygen-independent coproporphyrinogen III oxidase n=1 Tax=Bernardetia sp. ABR2-2B TaxID=3127472 RepID=UPI0030D42C5D